MTKSKQTNTRTASGEERPASIPARALAVPVVLLIVAVASAGVLFTEATTHDTTGTDPTGARGPASAREEVAAERDSFVGLLTPAAPMFSGSMRIAEGGHPELEVTLTFQQPGAGTIGPVLVYIDIVAPDGEARVDGYGKGGMYMVVREPVMHTFRIADVPAGDWSVALELWYMSVPVEFELQWTAHASMDGSPA